MYTSDQREANVRDWLTIWSGDDQMVSVLLWHSVGRVVLTNDEDLEFFDFETELARTQAVGHIADWLKVAVADKAPWLARVDDLGRPKKLMKLNSLEAIVAEADKQMRRKQSGIQKSAVVDGEEQLHFDLGDGWSLVKLLSYAALDRESKAMQHCIGHGAYDDHLENQDALLLSLRDPSGNPHVTMEIVDGRLVQFQGKQNKAPVEKYVSKVLPYLSERKIACDGRGFVTDIRGVVYSVGRLPEVLEVDGSVYLHNPGESELRLPREIIARAGNLEISGNAFSNVPERIVCHDLRVSGASLGGLPDNLKVRASISLRCSRIATIPHNLWVKGSLDLAGTPVTALPRGLRVDGVLLVSQTDITEFPEDLRTGGIDMRDTPVMRIDTAWLGIGVGKPKNLLARGSALEEIVGAPVFRCLELAETKVKRLPEGLQVHDLDISSTSISSVPSDATITGDLRAINCRDLRIEVTHVGLNVELQASRVHMPETFECGGMFAAEHNVVGRLPSRLKATKVRHASIEAIPAFVDADAVDIASSPVKRLNGTLKARELTVSRDFEYFGAEVDVDEVRVAEAFFGSTKLSLDEAKRAIALHGNLRKDHNGKSTDMRFSGLVSGLPGGGKTFLASAMIAGQRARQTGGRVVMLDTETVPDVPGSLLPRYGDFAGIERRLRRDAEAARRAQNELMDAPVVRTPILPLVFPLLPPTASRNDARRQANRVGNPPEWWGEMRATMERNMQTYVHRPLTD
jgi:hypothetical protein